MQPKRTIQCISGSRSSSKALWLCYWIISTTASAGSAITKPATTSRLYQDNNTARDVSMSRRGRESSSTSTPNGMELIGLRRYDHDANNGGFNIKSTRSKSSNAEASVYSFRRPNNDQEGGAYAFGYDNARDSSGNEHFRFEERFPNGTVIGEYGFTDYQRSLIVTVTYTADENGFRPMVKIRRTL